MPVVVTPIKDGATTVAAFSAVTALRLFANCQPANRPVPKIRASASTSNTIAPTRPNGLRGRRDGGAWSIGVLGGGNEPCSRGAGVTGGVSSTSTGTDACCCGKNVYDS